LNQNINIQAIIKQIFYYFFNYKAKAYVPPHLRGTNKASNFNSKLHDDDEKPDNKLKIKPSDAALDAEKKIKNLKKVRNLTNFI
jgi:hypothetical protein